MRTSLFKRSSLLLLLTAGGGILGASIILFGYPFLQDDVSQRFVKQPGFLVWLFLVVLLVSLLALSAVPMWLSLTQLKKYFQHNALDVTLSTLLVIGLMIAPFPFSTLLFPIHSVSFLYQSEKVTVILLFALVTVAPAVASILLIRAACQSMLASIQLAVDESTYLTLIKEHIHFRALLQQHLSILGLLIALVTLATGALRNVEVAVGGSESQFPITLVIVYGLFYTAIVALIYIPTYLPLQEAGRSLRDRIYPMDSLRSLLEDTENRAKLDELLKLNMKSEQTLRAGIAILAPLLSGLVSALLGLNL